MSAQRVIPCQEQEGKVDFLTRGFMAQHQPAGPAQAQPVAATMVEEQEVESVRRLLALLEKTFKTSRAYGPTHHLPQQFMQQLYETLAAHLAVRGTLSLLVQRFEFYYRGEMVYQKAAQNENLAFKLYGAGIRELSFSHGLSQETLSSFLETLGAAYEMTTSDDDVITRLWEKNLSAVSIVTAEEIVKNESHQDTRTYLLDMLKVIAASEKSADVLFELRGLFREIFESLIDEGNWKQLNSVVDKLREVHRRGDLAEEQKKAVSDMLDSLHGPKQMDAMASRLNADPHVATEDLLVFFLHLPPNAVPSLCKLLGNLKFDEHRLTLCDVLAALAKDKPEPLIKGLTDSRWSYVRNLLVVIGKFRNPSLAQAVQPLAAHPDAGVRREALKTLSMLGGTGMGNPIVGVLIDPDEGIRLSALSLLKTGKYTTPFSAWTPVVTHKEFLNRPLSELRTTFEVMTRLVGAECVPYCHHLLTQRLWTNRKTKQSLGALAAEALGQIGTPEAISALEAGKKRFNRVIRHASVTALATLKRRDL